MQAKEIYIYTGAWSRFQWHINISVKSQYIYIHNLPTFNIISVVYETRSRIPACKIIVYNSSSNVCDALLHLCCYFQHNKLWCNFWSDNGCNHAHTQANLSSCRLMISIEPTIIRTTKEQNQHLSLMPTSAAFEQGTLSQSLSWNKWMKLMV